VIVNRLAGIQVSIIFAWATFAITIVGTFFEQQSDNPFPYADATMLVYSLIATVMMIKHYAEQWLFWTGANVMCIYMWVLPALDGDGSLPIVVMWTVFTINALYGLYKWYWVRIDK
jgi:nicotinamide mononucleotide transporter